MRAAKNCFSCVIFSLSGIRKYLLSKQDQRILSGKLVCAPVKLRKWNSFKFPFVYSPFVKKRNSAFTEQ